MPNCRSQTLKSSIGTIPKNWGSISPLEAFEPWSYGGIGKFCCERRIGTDNCFSGTQTHRLDIYNLNHLFSVGNFLH
jgi:hypothetical protein